MTLPTNARRAAGIAATVVVIAGVIALGWTRHHYNAWVWQSLPDQFSICGRDYLGPGDIASLDQMTADGDRVIGHVRTFVSTHEVWGVTQGPAGDRCGTGVYVRTGARSFRAYALSGGP